MLFSGCHVGVTWYGTSSDLKIGKLPALIDVGNVPTGTIAVVDGVLRERARPERAGLAARLNHVSELAERTYRPPMG
jgi:hypothetical protein